ncbi:uncharacterized protein LOC128553808 [Mercenaria mercenaria]|uniref:uncharacterized protein LOC128553808 n=1 Tax=Mercenaria mercenaria TaxID=6596 RepID=UPI00234FAE41|nr:uncharacterized protein LOC128553808 [Mercenaria mercenaria]
MAIYFALLSLYSECKNVHIEFQSDSVTAVKYVNDMGGMTSPELDRLSAKIWSWCLERNIFISAVYIKGFENVEADWYSRNFSDSTEWRLKPWIFNRLCSHFFMPDIDLFASRINKQLDTFISWFPEPGAVCNDAFSCSWHDYEPYIFPPFNLISKVVNKIAEDSVERALVVVPFWKSQPWFPLLLQYVASLPVRLPRHKDLLTLAHDRTLHQIGKSLNLIGVMLSGNRYILENFQQELSRSSFKHGEQGQENNMVWLGNSGIFGVLNNVKIPFTPMK